MKNFEGLCSNCVAVLTIWLPWSRIRTFLVKSLYFASIGYTLMPKILSTEIFEKFILIL
jgi:hypothetical protein